jgi:hypothetical protein
LFPDKCEAGYVSSDSGCEPCDMNFYQSVQFPLSTDKCKPCPPKDGRITNTKTEGTTTVENCLRECYHILFLYMYIFMLSHFSKNSVFVSEKCSIFVG